MAVRADFSGLNDKYNPLSSGFKRRKTILERELSGRAALNKIVYPSDTSRIDAYKTRWAWYFGDQFDWQRSTSEPLTVHNYIAAIMDRNIMFMSRGGFDVDMPIIYDKLEVEAEYLWSYYKKPKFLKNVLTTGSVTGDCFILTGFNDKTSLPTCEVLNSTICFPEYDIHNAENMLSFTISYYFVPDGQADPILRTIYMNAEEIIYKDGIKVTGRFPNILGRIPVVHIKNIEIDGLSYGLSDVDVIQGLNQEYNEKTQDVSDILDYHAAPTTVVKGAKTKNLVKGPNKVWGVPQNADVFNLNLQSDLSASNTYIEGLKQSLYVRGKTNAYIMGEEGVSGTSAIALEMQFYPVIEHKDLKALTYGPGLSQVTTNMLDYQKLKGDDKVYDKIYTESEEAWKKSRVTDRRVKPWRNSVDINIEGSLPKDRPTLLDEMTLRINNGTISRPEAIKRLEPQLSEAEIAEWLVTIDADPAYNSQFAPPPRTVEGATEERVGKEGAGMSASNKEKGQESTDTANNEAANEKRTGRPKGK